MKKFLIVLLSILGFPALIGLIAYNSFEMIKGGLSYGVFVFVGLIITVVFALIYFFVCLGMKNSAKRKGKKNLYHQTFVAMILAFCLLGGFWMVIDVALPDFLADATSNTVYYEDLADNYYARSVVNKNLLDEYIRRNVNNGNLKAKTLEEYQKEGIKNEEVSKMLAIHFASIDKAGYATFAGPNIDLALGDRMTIAVLVHLLLDGREVPELDYYLYDKSADEIITTPVNWNVLDMLGEPMGLATLDFLATEEKYQEFITGMGATGSAIKALYPTVTSFSNGVAGIVNNLLLADLTKELTSSSIYLGIASGELQLVPSNEVKGVLDYQSMGWLNSNGLLYAIVMLFSLRKFFLIWAAWMVLSTLLIGLLRGMGKELKSKEQKTGKVSTRTGSFSNSYVEMQRPSDFANLDMLKMREQFMQDCKQGVARAYLPHEL